MSENEAMKKQYETVLKRVTEMAESIKQAIVLLQIAKNATVPDEPGAVKEFAEAPALAEVAQKEPANPRQPPPPSALEVKAAAPEVQGAAQSGAAADNVPKSQADAATSPKGSATIMKPGKITHKKIKSGIT